MAWKTISNQKSGKQMVSTFQVGGGQYLKRGRVNGVRWFFSPISPLSVTQNIFEILLLKRDQDFEGPANRNVRWFVRPSFDDTSC